MTGRGSRTPLQRVGALVVAMLAAAAVAASAGDAGAGDLVDLGSTLPRVRFDMPRAVIARDAVTADDDDLPFVPAGQRLVTVEVPVSVVVTKGEVRRVEEIVVEVDGAAAGLTVHDYSPATRLESDYTSDIEVQSTTERNHHLDGTLGGILPSTAGSIAQLTPSASAGRTKLEAETEKHARRAPKEAIVVAGAINRRQGVLFKFRPSSQTTLEGERRLAITFVAPADWTEGELSVTCRALGKRKMLFVKKRETWGAVQAPVEISVAPSPTHTAAKPVIPATDATSDRSTIEDKSGLLWKRRVPTDAF